ncbi:MAG: Wzz/FepE/Etk N-terminal domain-containing protein [Ruminococcus sp.]|nr:Wzz/FepE/Etk N-terminal domain-containing protein [Ruminococcus sp.]
MEISFKDILRILKKNLVLIIVTTVLFSALSYFYTSFFVKKTYTATVKLYVVTENKASSGYDSLQAYNYAEKLVSTYIQMLDTNSFYSEVSKNMNEKYTPSQLSYMISFRSVEGTEVFEADVVTTSPTEAKAVADAVGKVAPKRISKLNKNAELKVVDPATVPTAPTAPSVTRNILIGFIAGLVLSVIISFVRDYFDVKIKYNEEMTSLGGYPVLAAIPDFEYFTNAAKKGKSSKKSGSKD